MRFASYTFIIFFIFFLLLYWSLKKCDHKNLVLLIAGYIFYGWVHPWFCLVLFISTIIDYFLALRIAGNPGQKRLLIIIGLLVNIGTLVFFKYNNYFITGLQDVLSVARLECGLSSLKIIAPVGLSFFTLKKISYILDVSRKPATVEKNILSYALFISFFPQITSGPIDRPQNLLHQINKERRWKKEYFYSSWPLIVMGLLKKVVIADNITSVVDRIFTLQQPSILLLIAGAAGFSIQLLADFSGYTDLSRGIAQLIGFTTPENFKAPYLALTPTDFWNRWHITLSKWLQDYIFFPLRRSCLRLNKTYSSLLALLLPPLLTMLISGFWHGTGWTYIIWGGYYGILIILYQAAGFGGAWKPGNFFTRTAAWLLMLSLIIFGWMIFRSPSIEWLTHIFIHSSFSNGKNDIIAALVSLSSTAGYSLFWLIKYLIDRINFHPVQSWLYPLFYAVSLAVIIVFINSSAPDFIYFQF